MFDEDLSLFFPDFSAAGATLAGVAVNAIVDDESFVGEDGALVNATSAILTAADAASAQRGQIFATPTSRYIVRCVHKVPPDGALRRLELAQDDTTS